jgi:hypothetical protein
MKLTEYLQQNGVTIAQPNVKFSKPNNYPFLTFVAPSNVKDEPGTAYNLFFTKNASAEVSPDTSVKDIIRDLFVVEVVSDGGPRTKLSFNEQKYVDITDLF